MEPADHHIKISIIEDNVYIRQGWSAVLSNEPDFEIIGVYGTCEEAFAAESFRASTLVIMDIGLPGMSGIDGVRWIANEMPRAVTIMCTVFEDDDKVFAAICAGAVGYLLKKTPAEEFIKGIRSAATGGSPMTPSIARKVLAQFQKPSARTVHPDDEITEREREVLNLLARGKSYAVIGEQLFLSMDGVRYHIRHIYEKLQVHTRGEAVAKGISGRLIDPIR